MTHGTRKAYRHGCRCLPCKAANATYWSAWYRDRRQGVRRLGSRVPADHAWTLIRRLLPEYGTKAALAAELGYQTRTLQLQRTAVLLRNVLKLRRLHRQAVTDALDETCAPRTAEGPDPLGHQRPLARPPMHGPVETERRSV